MDRLQFVNGSYLGHLPLRAKRPGVLRHYAHQLKRNSQRGEQVAAANVLYRAALVLRRTLAYRLQLYLICSFTPATYAKDATKSVAAVLAIDYWLLDQLSDLSAMLSGTLVTEIDEVRTLNDPGVSMPVISQILVGLCAMHQHDSGLYRFKQEFKDLR